MKHVSGIDAQICGERFGPSPEREQRLSLRAMLWGKCCELLFQGLHRKEFSILPSPSPARPLDAGHPLRLYQRVTLNGRR